ncbi:MAG: hypothetical protein LAN84_02245 [Acidobacteriia bacterium]|nr:hypothetical protein [Terriglobia bacterium]
MYKPLGIAVIALVLLASASAPAQQSAPLPLKGVQPQNGPKRQGQPQTPASSDPRLRAPAMKIKLGLPKTSPKVLNPRAALHDAAVIAVLQRQKQTADIEAARMKIGIRPAGPAGLPAVQSPPKLQPQLQPQSQPMPASGANSPNKAKAPAPANIQKAPATGTIAPGKVSDAPGNNPSLYAQVPQIDTTVLTCAHDPSMRILKVSGDAAPATFTPIEKYNLYTISGCSFGGSNANNKVYIFGKGSFQGNFLIRFWSENSITIALDPALSGVLDQDNLTLVVQRADGTQVNKNGFKFYAARGDLQGNPVPLAVIAPSQFSAKMPFDSQTLILPNTYTSPAPDSTPADPTTEVDRLFNTPPWAPTTDTFQFKNLAAGFFPASAILVYWYIVPPDCPGLLEAPNVPVRKVGDPTLDIQGNWDVAWDVGNLVVHTQVEGCRQRYVGPGNSDASYFTSFSRYAVEVWVLGPRCVNPWTGLPDPQCVSDTKKQLSQL